MISDDNGGQGKTVFSLDLRQIASWQFPDLVEKDIKAIPLCVGIPSLQRGAIWNPGQVEILWDSIFRGFPIGSFVVCSKIATQRTRSGKHGPGWPENEIVHHLLDGQQRCNAIALGFLDPFDLEKHISNPPAVIWLDLRPPKLTDGSTRRFLFRILTTAHPWGYRRNDATDRLGVEEIRKAIEEYKKYGGDKPFHRAGLFPHLSWPPAGAEGVTKSAAVPLAWLLNSLRKVVPNDIR